MSETPELPPLPEPAFKPPYIPTAAVGAVGYMPVRVEAFTMRLSIGPTFTPEQVSAYGRECWDAGRRAGLEEAAKDRQDAQRYRHMRASAAFLNRNGPGLYWYLPRDVRGDEGQRLDEAIDTQLRIAEKRQPCPRCLGTGKTLMHDGICGECGGTGRAKP